jgi:hypothetical protein
MFHETSETGVTDMKERFWVGDVPPSDDFGDEITDVFIDGKTRRGPWAIMTPRSHKLHGMGLGTGYGQKYKQDKRTSKWVKIDG